MDSFATESLPSSSSSVPVCPTYDVFFNFRAADTLTGFTGHLNSNLLQNGIRTYLDAEVFTKEEEIRPSLLKAIERSRIAIVIFSENYASSAWCLDQLLQILQCRDLKCLYVIPVFYKVDPLHVLKQTGPFQEAFGDHERRFKDNRVLAWREALTEVASLASLSEFILPDGARKVDVIESITKKVSEKVRHLPYLEVAKYAVGIGSRLQEIHQGLGVGVDDVRMVAICGIRGSGKTTLAKAVFNSVAYRFEGCCFLANVRENSLAPGHLVQRERILLSDLLEGKILEFTSVDNVFQFIKKRSKEKKALLILDDVDPLLLEVLKKLAEDGDGFVPGSRIIITARSQEFRPSFLLVEFAYEVTALDPAEAFELFIRSAFPDDKSLPGDFKELAYSVVEYAKGIPLALTETGSLLHRRSKAEWQAVVESYKRSPALDADEIIKITKNVLENAAVKTEEEEVEIHEDLQDDDEDADRALLARRVSTHTEFMLQRGPPDGSPYGQPSGTPAGEPPREPGSGGFHGGPAAGGASGGLGASGPGSGGSQGGFCSINVGGALDDPGAYGSSIARPNVVEGWHDWIFLFTGFFLELCSAVCDQLSSHTKLYWAAVGRVLAFLAAICCLAELCFQARKQKVERRYWCGGVVYWFFNPTSGEPLGTFIQMYGLLSALSQFGSSYIQFDCLAKNQPNPIKVNLLPPMFVFCSILSKFIRKWPRPPASRTTIQMRARVRVVTRAY